MLSMTGFGVARGKAGRSHIVVEARSVNHRFCEVNLRFPGRFASLEPEVTRLVRERFARGKFDLYLREELMESDAIEIALAKKAHRLLKRIQRELNIRGPLNIADLLAFRDVFSSGEPREEINSIRRPFIRLFDQALSGLLQMREREGARLQKWFEARALVLGRLLAAIEKHSAKRGKECRRRLDVQLKGIGQVQVEEERLIQEAAMMAGRADVMEEIVRLRSHIHEFKRFIRERGPVGRRIDFLTQEMGREINTVGSKSQGVRLTHDVIEFKSDLERIKEQIQNVE